MNQWPTPNCLEGLDLLRWKVSYPAGATSIYVSVATLADKQLGNVLGQIFGSPWAIALQVGLLVAVCLLPLVNWRRFLDRTTKP